MIILFIKILFVNLLGFTADIERDLNNYLEAHLKDYERIEFTIISPKGISEIPFELDNSRDFKVNGSFAYIPVREYLSDGSSKNSVLTLKLKLYQNVLVANRNLNKKEFLYPEDFRIIEKEISDLRYEPVNSSVPFNVYRTKVRIKENSIVQSSMLEKIPQIENGDRVDAIFSKSFINISFKVTARSSGDIGSIIKVKRDDRKIFKARIINNSTVQIIE